MPTTEQPEPEQPEEPTPEDATEQADDGGQDPEEIIDLTDTSAIEDFDAQVAEFYAASAALGEGRVIVHRGAQQALLNERPTVLCSLAMLTAMQRTQRLAEWAGMSPEGSYCPVCGRHRRATERAQTGPNRGHANDCPLRKNLDNLNRAIGTLNRGRQQGPGAAIVWEGRLNGEHDSTPASCLPNELTAEGAVQALARGGASIGDGWLKISENNLTLLLKLWTLGRCNTARMTALGGQTVPEAMPLEDLEAANETGEPEAEIQPAARQQDQISEDRLGRELAEEISRAESPQSYILGAMLEHGLAWSDLVWHEPPTTVDAACGALTDADWAKLADALRERAPIIGEDYAAYLDAAAALRITNKTPYQVGDGTFRHMTAWVQARGSQA